jgi:hypothetical protein
VKYKKIFIPLEMAVRIALLRMNAVLLIWISISNGVDFVHDAC